MTAAAITRRSHGRAHCRAICALTCAWRSSSLVEGAFLHSASVPRTAGWSARLRRCAPVPPRAPARLRGRRAPPHACGRARDRAADRAAVAPWHPRCPSDARASSMRCSPVLRGFRTSLDPRPTAPHDRSLRLAKRIATRWPTRHRLQEVCGRTRFAEGDVRTRPLGNDELLLQARRLLVTASPSPHSLSFVQHDPYPVRTRSPCPIGLASAPLYLRTYS
jgi:hypothetical protein